MAGAKDIRVADICLKTPDVLYSAVALEYVDKSTSDGPSSEGSRLMVVSR